nr:ADP-ribosylglycohydrolase family protein [uncultured Marinifilum sp.]
MKEYSGNESDTIEKFHNDLRSTEGINTLYVSHYYFALDNGIDLLFYYNPQLYWDKIPVTKVKNYVWNNLKKECAVFKNFNIDAKYNTKLFENWTSYDAFFPETPKIGNHYSCLGNRILSHHRSFYCMGAFGGCGKQNVKKLIEKDVQELLHYAVMTNTPNYIKSIYDLKCFKKQQKIHSNTIIGAVIGDVIGSVYEWNNIKSTEFNLFNPKCKFTDDTVLTIAVADSILNNKDYSQTILNYGRKYRGRGYGGNFRNWLKSNNPKPYGSYGNGSAMRVSAVGFAYNDIDRVLEVAKQTAEVTHNHPEGIKGAQATAVAIFLARQGKSKQEIKNYISSTFNYNLDFTLDEIRPTYEFDVSCQGSVPQAIVAFLESSDFESAIRLAISIGGDSDTIACITGGIASAFYKNIPTEIIEFVSEILPNEFIEIMNRFDKEKMTNT